MRATFSSYESASPQAVIGGRDFPRSRVRALPAPASAALVAFAADPLPDPPALEGAPASAWARFGRGALRPQPGSAQGHRGGACAEAPNASPCPRSGSRRPRRPVLPRIWRRARRRTPRSVHPAPARYSDTVLRAGRAHPHQLQRRQDRPAAARWSRSHTPTWCHRPAEITRGFAVRLAVLEEQCLGRNGPTCFKHPLLGTRLHDQS
jgi:hypothetical protein